MITPEFIAKISVEMDRLTSFARFTSKDRRRQCRLNVGLALCMTATTVCLVAMSQELTACKTRLAAIENERKEESAADAEATSEN